MDGVTGPGGPTASSATGSLYNSSELRQQGGGPLTSLKGWQASGGLQAPDWLPGVVGQGGGAIEGSQPRTLRGSSPSPRGGSWRLRAQHRTSLS